MSSVTQTGVYFGYAQVSPEKNGETVLPEQDSKVLPMVMSLGWNPFYKNERLTAVCLIIPGISNCLSLTLLQRNYILCMISTPISTDMR